MKTQSLRDGISAVFPDLAKGLTASTCGSTKA
jgi:hypothetical protein